MNVIILVSYLFVLIFFLTRDLHVQFLTVIQHDSYQQLHCMFLEVLKGLCPEFFSWNSLDCRSVVASSV